MGGNRDAPVGGHLVHHVHVVANCLGRLQDGILEGRVRGADELLAVLAQILVVIIDHESDVRGVEGVPESALSFSNSA